MKLNSLEFKQYILNEVKNIAKTEGWDNNINLLSENVIHSLDENEFELVDPAEWNDNTVNISVEDNTETLKQVNSLNEELKRMRELVDFRNPLFKQL